MAGEEVARVRLDAKGSPDASDLTLAANARGFDLDARARLIPGDRTRIEITKLDARRGKERIGLAEPAAVVLVPGGAQIERLAVALGQGRLELVGQAGSSLDIAVTARRLPLAAADLVQPGLDLAGTLDGTARITGSPAEPNGSFNLRSERRDRARNPKRRPAGRGRGAGRQPRGRPRGPGGNDGCRSASLR